MSNVYYYYQTRWLATRTLLQEKVPSSRVHAGYVRGGRRCRRIRIGRRRGSGKVRGCRRDQHRDGVPVGSSKEVGETDSDVVVAEVVGEIDGDVALHAHLPDSISITEFSVVIKEHPVGRSGLSTRQGSGETLKCGLAVSDGEKHANMLIKKTGLWGNTVRVQHLQAPDGASKCHERIATLRATATCPCCNQHRAFWALYL